MEGLCETYPHVVYEELSKGSITENSAHVDGNSDAVEGNCDALEGKFQHTLILKIIFCSH